MLSRYLGSPCFSIIRFSTRSFINLKFVSLSFPLTPCAASRVQSFSVEANQRDSHVYIFTAEYSIEWRFSCSARQVICATTYVKCTSTQLERVQVDYQDVSRSSFDWLIASIRTHTQQRQQQRRRQRRRRRKIGAGLDGPSMVEARRVRGGACRLCAQSGADCPLRGVTAHGVRALEPVLVPHSVLILRAPKSHASTSHLWASWPAWGSGSAALRRLDAVSHDILSPQVPGPN